MWTTTMMTSVKTRKNVLIKSVIACSLLLFFVWMLLPAHNNSLNSNVGLGQDNTLENNNNNECTRPYPGKPLKQYAIMIDAGSSGSRVHVYRFNYCQKEPQLENEVFRMLKPGLSSYKDDPLAAAHSLDELMKIAVDSVPPEFHHCTPLAVKATAGLRLLGKDISDKILAQVRSHLENTYPFPIAGDNGVEIMDGSDEGVYAWITVNYLLGKLKTTQRGKSAAVFDLGGASTQIVFEPTFKLSTEKMADGDHKYDLDYGEDDPYSLYQHSYLGYGLNEARKKIKESVVDLWMEKGATAEATTQLGKVYHPCLPENHTENLTYIPTASNQSQPMNLQLIGTGAGTTQCRGIVEKLFNKNTQCNTAPCSFNGIYQPSLTDNFDQRDLFVFSYFFDLTQPLGMPVEFSVAELGTLTHNVCSGNTNYFQHIPKAVDIVKADPDYCLHLTYAYTLLKTGYELPQDRIVKTAQKIHGVETGWCLGASIAMIDSYQICKS